LKVWMAVGTRNYTHSYSFDKNTWWRYQPENHPVAIF